MPAPGAPRPIQHPLKAAMLAHGVNGDTPPLKGLRMQPDRLQMGLCRNGVTAGWTTKGRTTASKAESGCRVAAVVESRLLSCFFSWGGRALAVRECQVVHRWSGVYWEEVGSGT